MGCWSIGMTPALQAGERGSIPRLVHFINGALRDGRMFPVGDDVSVSPGKLSQSTTMHKTSWTCLSRNDFRFAWIIASLVLASTQLHAPALALAKEKPNFIIIFADDNRHGRDVGTLTQ